jgi:predicted nucleic acid-binding protein
LPAVPATLARLYRLEIDATVRSSAAALAEPNLRTLDAIHVATAAGIGADLQAFVTYDERLLQTAGELGLPVVSPGA